MMISERTRFLVMDREGQSDKYNLEDCACDQGNKLVLDVRANENREQRIEISKKDLLRVKYYSSEGMRVKKISKATR